jgi:hypothetical protein
MAVITHEQIKTESLTANTDGVLSMAGILWGKNALQNITITRNSPKDPQQAIGHLGIVDYTTGVVTSEVTLDCILVESCDKADPSTDKKNSIYRYAAQAIAADGSESYVLTSFAMSLAAGAPATVNFGYMTPTIASRLTTQAQPSTVEQGEESSYAVVMGDDGSGLILVPTWDAAFTPDATHVPYIDKNGALQSGSSGIDGHGLPAGVQRLNFNGTINRDHVLDMRTAQPVQFVTTYPLDMRCDMDIFNLPTASAATPANLWDMLQGIAIQALNLDKHRTGFTDIASSGDNYLRAIGFRKVSDTESVSVGQYLTYSVNFIVADLVMPLPQIS